MILFKWIIPNWLLNWDYPELLKLSFVICVGYVSGRFISDFISFLFRYLLQILRFRRLNKFEKNLRKNNRELNNTAFQLMNLNKELKKNLKK